MSKPTSRKMPATGDLVTRKQTIHLQSIPSRYQRVFKTAYAGRSLRAAVSAFCLDCVGLDPDEIRHCSALACPIWAVRTYRSTVSKDKAPIRAQGGCHGQ